MNKLFEQLLKKRGIDSDFLNPVYENSTDPMKMKDMELAVKRIKKAVREGERILIFGDYDVDGVTASTVMYDALVLAGAKEVEIMLPDRFKDGYGMSKKVVQRAKEKKIPLVVTVDCGSSNAEIINELIDNGTDVIVTDHHECPEVLPRALAVINPKRKDEENEKLKVLAGVGVAFMVARALVQQKMIPEGQEKWMLDLVLIGTICDNMRLVGENRLLCYFGMKVLEKTRRAGVKELMKVAGMKYVNGESIGFQIGPRLNAAGRMKSADIALNLLMEKDRAKAAKIAWELSQLNEQRRQQQLAAVEEIKNGEKIEEPVVVARGEWGEGILGIIAGRLCEDYRKPAFAFSYVKDEGVYKGSGRSFGDFNLKVALDECRDVILSGGGHAGACGIKVSEKKIDEFDRRINEYYRGLKLKNQEKYLERKVDVETDELEWFDLDFMDDLKRLEPFGDGNEEPLFGFRDVFVLDKKMIGKKGEHLRLLVRGSDEKTMKVMGFFAPEEWMEIENGDRVDIDVTMVANEWNGLKSVEGRIVKMTLAGNGKF